VTDFPLAPSRKDIYSRCMGMMPRETRLQITAPRFDFRKLVLAHGWAFLAPFEWDDEQGRLARPMRLPDSRHVHTSVSVASNNGRSVATVRVRAEHALSTEDRRAVRGQVRRMLRLDEDFSEFHRLCASDPDLRFVARLRCGGLLRAPSAFEDMVKTVCTTNCDWRNTKKMADSLCALAGGGFPAPEDLLPYSPRRLAKLAPVGYRAGTIIELGRRCAEGQLPVDAWAAQGDFARVREALAEIKGFGPYSINHVLVLLGAYDGIPVDSEVLAYLRRTHFDGRAVGPTEAVRPYDRYGRFRFLAFKFGRMGRKLNYIDK